MWVNYNNLTAIMVNKGNHPKMAFFQVSDFLICPDIRAYIFIYNTAILTKMID